MSGCTVWNVLFLFFPFRTGSVFLHWCSQRVGVLAWINVHHDNDHVFVSGVALIVSWFWIDDYQSCSNEICIFQVSVCCQVRCARESRKVTPKVFFVFIYSKKSGNQIHYMLNAWNILIKKSFIKSCIVVLAESLVRIRPASTRQLGYNWVLN